MTELSLNDYKKYVSYNPENTALIRKSENTLILLSDMEYGGEYALLRIEKMFFDLDTTKPFSESIVDCRSHYLGGITFELEDCTSFDDAFSFFINQSNSKNYWLIENNSWGEILNLDFHETFVILAE
ncbi:MAG: hypothetical protein E7384_00705 [Ruminococcaceae bacterium]|nr:hypothetical protein [Oscillospiraceae bacterium]